MESNDKAITEGNREGLKSRSMCDGCFNDFYNHAVHEGCWSFKTAVVVERVKVGIWDEPPYKRVLVKVLSCRKDPGFSWLKPDDERIK